MRAARFHFEKDRLRWTSARAALRVVLSRYLGIASADVVFVLGEHGKPFAAGGGVEFNLSHSGDWAMIAVSREIPVGVDIEAIRDNIDIAKLLTRMKEMDLPEGNTALFRRWTEREAKTKAAGMPLMVHPEANVFTVGLQAPEGYAAAVALVGALPEPIYCDGGL